MDSGSRLSGVIGTRNVALIATLYVCAGWSAAALGATSTETDCNEVARGLKSLQTPPESLSATPVDHVSIESFATDIDSTRLQPRLSDSITPYIYLTPRVASVLRDIFGATEETDAADRSPELPSSPIAESEELAEITDATEEVAPPSRVDRDIELPLFRRQMFRTDI